MGSWEQTISNALHAFGLDSIKSKILVFALLATLIPSLTMGWLSYAYNKRALTGKTTEELRNVTSHTAREIDLWFKERLHDARVFASSYEVSENLEKILRAHEAPIRRGRALGRLKDYLNAVQANVIHYEELLVIGPKADVLATSAGEAGRVNLPPDSLKEAKKMALREIVWARPPAGVPRSLKSSAARYGACGFARLGHPRQGALLRPTQKPEEPKFLTWP